ncbi:MAG: hypothetical protein WC054_12840, partial [Candidatus Nanopelagicales bacterium]
VPGGELARNWLWNYVSRESSAHARTLAGTLGGNDLIVRCFPPTESRRRWRHEERPMAPKVRVSHASISTMASEWRRSRYSITPHSLNSASVGSAYLPHCVLG